MRTVEGKLFTNREKPFSGYQNYSNDFINVLIATLNNPGNGYKKYRLGNSPTYSIILATIPHQSDRGSLQEIHLMVTDLIISPFPSSPRF
jgi:hypothetical protein